MSVNDLPQGFGARRRVAAERSLAKSRVVLDGEGVHRHPATLRAGDCNLGNVSLSSDHSGLLSITDHTDKFIK